MRAGLRLLTAAFLMGTALVTIPGVATAAAPPPSPIATCGPGSNPETGLQGRVSGEDVASGRYLEGYWCNTELVGDELAGTPLGTFGGFKVERYVDAAGNECAYYDLQLLAGTGIADISKGLNAGIAVLDMADPANPVRTATLTTVAAITPHESMLVVPNRGLLVAVSGTAALAPGVMDIWDLSEDCRHPRQLNLPNVAGIIGHESGVSPDGMTFYSGAPIPGSYVSAVDISNPSSPRTLTSFPFPSHGMTLSADGNTMYLTQINPTGVRIIDVSEIQARKPSPQVREIGSVSWEGTIPQIARPVTIDGHPYLVEIDEFGALGYASAIGVSAFPGAGRIIDIGDPTAPEVISDFRLEVHQPEHFQTLKSDPGSAQPVGGYSGHYCNVPRRADPGIVACGMENSGLRIFDITDPYNPKEAAYYNMPSITGGLATGTPLDQISQLSIPPSWAMASPTVVPERCEVWYTDGRSGFRNVRLTNGVCDLMAAGVGETPPPTQPTQPAPSAPDPQTPATLEPIKHVAEVPTSIPSGSAGASRWLAPAFFGLGAGLLAAAWLERRRFRRP